MSPASSDLSALRLSAALAAVAAAACISGPVRAQNGNGDVPVVSADEIHALVDSHRGKIVVVNFWATWCPPCLEEFPDIIQVYDEYRDRGLEVFAVSMNEADEVEDIEAFLETFEPPFPVYRAASVDSEFYDGVVQPWFGEMPITLVFDATGRQVHYHRRAVDYAGLAADIDALIAAH